MKFDEKRSPEVILEYFKLLRWNKDGCKADDPAETLDSNEQLQSIKQDLNRIQVLIIEKESLASSNHKEVDRIKPVISSAEQNLLRLREEIILIRREKLQNAETNPQSEIFEQFKQSETPATRPLRLSGILPQFLLSISDDLKAIYLDIKQAIARLNFSILFQYSLTILVVILLCFRFTYLINVTFFVLLLSYITWKLVSTFRRYEKSEKQRYGNDEINRHYQAKQQRQQELESNLHELEQRYAKHEQYLNQQKLKEQDLINQSRAARGDLTNLGHSRDQQTENCQRTIEEIIKQERQSKLERLLHLEELTQQWLDKDIDRLTDRAMKKLNLRRMEFLGASEALKSPPIRILIGVAKNTSSRSLVEDSVEGNPKINKALNIRIRPEEFESESTYDGKKQKYGVYEFLVIFFCSNCFSYYKCYFNFIRSEHIDEEYCEYLYDSIVFTKVQEKSSVNMQNIDDRKQVYSKRLVIATNDGKVICFQIAKSRVESNLSSKLTQIDDAAVTIRKMLRQRRIDLQQN